MERLTGVVDHIIFQSDAGGFAVFRLRPDGDGAAATATCRAAPPLVGEQVELTGEWTTHARFGRQFKAAACQRLAPADERGIERFLASGAVKGIGPAMAVRLVKHFGAAALDVIERQPQRLLEVEGIGRKKADALHRVFQEQAELREVMLFLETRGVSGAYAGKIFAQYGSFAVEVLEKDPYRLAREVSGIGFCTADRLARSLGFAPDDAARIEAGFEYALQRIARAGHCCAPEEALVEETARLLRVERAEAARRLGRLLKENRLCAEDFHGVTLVYPRHLYEAEKDVAERLLRLKRKARPAGDGDFAAAVDAWERAAGVELAAAQRRAMLAALTHGVLVLTGGPGTGKTTVVRGMLAVLEAQGFKILLGAPTGRAAKRLGEATGREAATVHRLLEATGGADGAPLFGRDEDEPLAADVVVLDEASMMDIKLTHYFLRAAPEGCRVILVGDVDQLPAVGPGAVLKDIIRSERVPVVRLTEVFRQAGESMIVQNAHRINQGRPPDCRSSDEFQFIEAATGEAAAAGIVRLCAESLAADGFDVRREVQVLAPMHRHACGVENLNRLLQQALNPPAAGKASVAGANQTLREGDKVMQTRNNYEKNVFNGDIGFIERIADGKLTVRFADQDVTYASGEQTELQLAYAMSVHKSQGGEYAVVVMPLTPEHRVMLQRNLLYTAVTRAKERVVLFGAKAALQTAVASDRTRRRCTLLAERLRQEVFP